MKRSAPLRRKTPLRPGKPLQRKTPMKRGGPLKRKAKPAKTPEERRLMEAFVRGIRQMRCASCGRAAPAVTIRAHHVLRRQVIERVLRDRGLAKEEVDEAAWDPRNRLPLCDDCHQGHHSGMRRLALSLVLRLAPAAIVWAKTLDLLDHLKREYIE